MKSTCRHHLNRYSRTILLLVLISLLVVSCGTRTETGTVVGAGMAFSLDDAAEQVVEDMDFAGKIVVVELNDGTTVDAICDEQLWLQLQVGQRLEIALIEGSKYWKVVRFIDTPESQLKQPIQVEITSYSDFFPIEPGMEWSYQIEIGDIEPLQYILASCSSTEGRETFDWRQTFLGSFQNRSKKSFLLRMRVEGPVARKSLPPLYPDQAEIDVMELEVVADEMGVFENAQRVFWVTNHVKEKRMSVVDEVVVYNTTFDAQVCSPGFGNGFSVRPIFYDAGVGTEVKPNLFGIQSQQHLQFLGFSKSNQEPPIPYLHFCRKTQEEDMLLSPEQAHLGRSFTEDILFERGRGMIELHQQVEGQTSMHWTLLQFTQE